MRILVTGSAGFIGGYLVQELLSQGHYVTGIDNYSKYGIVKRSFDNHPQYTFIKGDVKETGLLKRLIKNCDYIIAGAAMIGGIQYFHTFAYDLLAENERIMASTFDAAIYAHKNYHLKKIVVLSSSMVYESATVFPTNESKAYISPPPKSTYGFQKLACEYYAKGAWEQYQLPYTIVRPFNCVGIGEIDPLVSKKHTKGYAQLATNHVVPDLIQKILLGQDPLHLLGNGRQIRHYTYGGDLAKGIILATFSKKATNEDFNLSTTEEITVLQLAKRIWKKIQPEKKFRYVIDKPFQYDVKRRIPDTKKAEKLLGFKATTTIDQMLDEVIPWVKKQMSERK